MRRLFIVSALLLTAAACQQDTGNETRGGGGGVPLLPNVTSVGPGAGPGPGAGGGGMGGATGPAGPAGPGPTTGPGGNGGMGGATGGAGGSPGCSTSPGAGDLVINEVHTSPDSNADDVNCDGSTSSQDEFIEIVNASGGELSLAGVELEENGTLRKTFSGCLAIGQAVVLYKSTFTSMCDAADWGTTQGVSADSNFTLTNGGGEVLTLKLGATTLDTVTTLNLGSTNPRTSMTRSPDVTGGFVEHTTADSIDASPFSVGTCVDGSFFPCN